jgi:hypothetical protein
MEAIEREVILRTLAAKRGNKTAAAEALGISRRSIYNKLAEYEAQGPSRAAPRHPEAPVRSSAPRARTPSKRFARAALAATGKHPKPHG